MCIYLQHTGKIHLKAKHGSLKMWFCLFSRVINTEYLIFQNYLDVTIIQASFVLSIETAPQAWCTFTFKSASCLSLCKSKAFSGFQGSFSISLYHSTFFFLKKVTILDFYSNLLHCAMTNFKKMRTIALIQDILSCVKTCISTTNTRVKYQSNSREF